MPRREYPKKEGKFGTIYKVARGITVRRDNRQQWSLEITRKGQRKSVTMGTGSEGRVKAIEAAEGVAKKLSSAALKTSSAKPSKPLKPTFSACAKEWFGDNQNRWSEETVTRYEAILRLHIDPHDLFRQPIDRVTRNQFKKHLRKLSKERSPALVEAVHAVVSSIFEEAIDSGLIRDNPARRLLRKILPKEHQRDVKDAAPMSITERDRLMAVAQTTCPASMRMALMVMAFMGLRLGEALALRLKHLDFGRMLYHVTESYKEGVFRKPKGGKSRFVDIPDFLAAELEAHVAFLKRERLRLGIGGPVDALLVNPKDGDAPFSQRDVQCGLRRACKAAGLEIRNPHDLRHTYATILLMAGVSPAYVQKQLGHSSISMTVDIYGHWIPGEGRAGLEAALAGGSKKGTGEAKIVPFSVPNLQISANENATASLTN
jgi:integrase